MQYATDDMLEYESIRWNPQEEVSLRFDENYCKAHLPLVAPTHPDAIHESGEYRMGVYDQAKYSLVLPIRYEELQESTLFQELNRALEATSLTAKIAHHVMEQRRDKLHATILGGLEAGLLSGMADTLHEWLHDHGPIRFRLGGPLIGTKNTGRIYFPVYPELVQGKNVMQHIQEQVGYPATSMYLLGYYNFTDHLTSQETDELRGILEKYKDTRILESASRQLWLMKMHDDLVLSGTVVHTVSM